MSWLVYRKAKFRWKRFWSRVEARVKRRLLAGFASVVHALLFLSVLGVRAENFAFDTWFSIRGPIPPPKEIVIVSLDHRSEEALGISPLAPWPRRHYADLLHALKRKEAKRVIFDIFFRAKGDEEDDRKLAEALRVMDSALGSFHSFQIVTRADGTKEAITREERPLEIFSQAARRVVPMNIWMRDPDQVIRHMSAASGILESRVPLIRALYDLLPPRFEEPGKQDYISYYGSASHLPTVSFIDALRDDGPEIFRNKIVFVGKHIATSFLRSDEKDTFRVPVPGYLMDGVEVHATIAGNLLQQSWVRRLDELVEVVLLAIVVSVLSYVIMSLRVLPAAFALFLFQGSWTLLAYQAFCRGYFVPGAVMMFLVLPLVFIGSVCLTALSLYRSFRQMEKAMGVKLPGSS